MTGLLLAWYLGFSTVGHGVWAGLALVLVAVTIGATVARPASNASVAGVESGNLEAARAAGVRVQRVLAVESVLWALALVAMLL